MFERPDAEYLQDLLAGYVLGHLDTEERRYLEEQIAQDPQLQQVLHQLEHALGSMSPPRSRTQAPAFYQLQQIKAVRPSSMTKLHPPVHRRTAKRIVIGSGVAAALAIAISTPWLISRYRLPNITLERWSGREPALKTDHSMDALESWNSLQQLIDDHIDEPHPDQTVMDPASDTTNQLMTTLQNYMPDAETLITLETAQTELLDGSHYAQTHLQGVRFTYQHPKTLISVYQLQLGIGHPIAFPPKGDIYLEAESGPNLVLWRHGHILYGIVAELPINELKQLSHSTNVR